MGWMGGKAGELTHKSHSWIPFNLGAELGVYPETPRDLARQGIIDYSSPKRVCSMINTSGANSG